MKFYVEDKQNLPDPIAEISAKLDRHMRELARAARGKKELSEDERFAIAYCAGASITLDTSDPTRCVWRTEPVAILLSPLDGRFLVGIPRHVTQN